MASPGEGPEPEKGRITGWPGGECVIPPQEEGCELCRLQVDVLLGDKPDPPRDTAFLRSKYEAHEAGQK